VKTYLDERKVGNLYQAAVMVDEYSPTHKGTFVKKNKNSAAPKGSHSNGYHQPSLAMEVARTPNRHLTHLEAATNPVFSHVIIVDARVMCV